MQLEPQRAAHGVYRRVESAAGEHWQDHRSHERPIPSVRSGARGDTSPARPGCDALARRALERIAWDGHTTEPFPPARIQ
jgi:hypothetical protein